MPITDQGRKFFIDWHLRLMAGGDQQKYWQLRKQQNKIDKELAKYKNQQMRAIVSNRMMMDSFQELRRLWNELNEATQSALRIPD